MIDKLTEYMPAWEARRKYYLPKPGDKVIIPKGTVVHTMHPSRDSYVTKRNQTITVNHVLDGYLDDYGRPFIEHPPRVRWPGSGGYWNESTVWWVPQEDNGK